MEKAEGASQAKPGGGTKAPLLGPAEEMPDGLVPGHPGEPHGEGVSGQGLLFPYIAETGLQELAQGLPAPQWRNDTKKAGCHQAVSHHGATSHAWSPAFVELHCPYSFPSSETFFQLSTLHHSSPPRTHSYALLLHLCTVSPCSPLSFLHSCPHHPSLPLSHHCSVFLLIGLGVGRKKPFSPLFLSSFPSTRIISPLWRRD